MADEDGVAHDRSDAVDYIAALERRIAGTRAEGGGPSSSSREVEPEAREGGGVNPAGPVVLAIGGAALVTAAIVGALVLVEDDELLGRCPEGRCSDRADLDMAAQVEQLALSADILWIAGATFAALGLVLTVLLRAESPALSAGCGEDGCGARFRGRF